MTLDVREALLASIRTDLFAEQEHDDLVLDGGSVRRTVQLQAEHAVDAALDVVPRSVT